MRSQIESADHFDDLIIRIVRSRTIAVLHDLVHEQTAISREQSAIFGTAGRKRCIGGVRIINDIKAEEAKITRQFSKVSVSDKFCDASSLQFLPRLRRRIIQAMDVDDGVPG
jgi:hypothetical protein